MANPNKTMDTNTDTKPNADPFGASDCSEFIDATKNLLSELIVPIMQSAHYGTPGKIVGWRCIVCNHDGSQVDFDHDPQCSFQMVISAIPKNK